MIRETSRMAATPKVIESMTQIWHSLHSKHSDICSNVEAHGTIKVSLFLLIGWRHADSVDLDCPVTSGTQKEAI